MKFTLIISLALALAIFGCQQESTSNADGQAPERHETHGDAHGDESHDEHEHGNGLNLNNGEKWKVKDSMIIHIRSGEQAVQDFEVAEEKDYVALANSLNESINLLTSNCTMEGEAHDQLHAWLVPYMGLVEDLAVAGEDPAAAEERYHAIQHSFETFNEYFN